MESFQYNARNFIDFCALSDSDDDEGEKFFDVDPEFDTSASTAVSGDKLDASGDEKDSKSAVSKTPEATYCKRKRVNSSHQPNKYVCMAEAVEKFQRTTPARFHTKPRYSKFEFKGKRLSHPRTTIPMSPHLQVIKRNRPVTALSRWQIEDMEVEEMKKHQVKARPVNEKIFNPKNINMSHQSHVIEVKPFNLTEWKRKIPEEPTPMVVKFKAQPVPKGLFDKKEGRHNVSAPNIPMRRRVPVIQKDKENETKISKKAEKKGPTNPSPFSFEERNKLLKKKKEEFVKKVIEEEKKAREFHANPIPKFSTKKLETSNWSISSTQSTVPKPFRLSSVDRSKAYREKFEKKIEEAEKLLKQAAEFKAKPAVVLSQKPFIPKKSEHHLEILDIHLNTEVRAEKRNQFYMEKKEREEELERMKMERKKRLEQQQEEEVAEMRKKTIHKANPVRSYKGITIHPSTKPLTSPRSPHTFSKKNRNHSHAEFSE